MYVYVWWIHECAVVSTSAERICVFRTKTIHYRLHTNDDDDDQKGKLSTDSNINLYIFRNNNNEK